MLNFITLSMSFYEPIKLQVSKKYESLHNLILNFQFNFYCHIKLLHVYDKLHKFAMYMYENLPSWTRPY